MIKDTRIVKDAVFLLDDRSSSGGNKGKVQSGWDIDYRSEAKPKVDVWFALCTDESSEYDVWMRRKLVPQTKGKVGLAQTFSVRYGTGFYLKYIGKNDKVALEINVIDGFFAVNGNKLPLDVENKHYCLAIDFDLDNKTAEVCFDDISYGTFKLKCGSFEQIKMGAMAHTDTCFSPATNRVWINYLLVDKCYCTNPGVISDKWNISSKGNYRVARVGGLKRTGSMTVYSAVCADSKEIALSRSFEKASGVICFEMKYHSQADDVNMSFSLTSGKKSIVTLNDNGSELMCEETLLRKHSVNVWQTLYIEVDLAKGSAKIMLNGKKCGCVPIEKAKTADGIKIEYQKDGGGAIDFTDILVYVKQPEPEDYVPAPVIPEKKDYYVGMNICSLWRNGGHWGWDTITPYDENETYLGYYDEGIPEVADWEIKWLAEHGVDFELYCWYNSQVNAPIMYTAHSAAIHDGHFKAKYGDMMKFAIIWEAANCAHAGIEGFRNHVVPYWMDYFFSDDRYYTIDNKVLISVFGSNQLIKDFGSEEAVKEQLDYVREEVKKLGYDGAIFMSCSKPTESVKNCGFDAVYAYNWGVLGYSPEYTKDVISTQRKEDILHVIPTVSTGFNSIGWNCPRTPQLSTDGMGSLFEWIKNDYLPESKGEDWKKKFVMLSTWNEYGEGTYMCPSNLCGFGYLDEIRKAFTKGEEIHEDARPDAKQLDRLGYIYPKGRRWVKSQQYIPKEIPSEVIGGLEVSENAWKPENLVSYFTDEKGRLCGKSEVHDPKIVYTLPLELDSSEVQNIRIVMRAVPARGGSTEAALYFITEKDSAWSESKGVRCITKGDSVEVYDFYVGEKSTWSGKITGFRFDPIDGAGEFEIESITLCTDTKTPAIILNGEGYNTSVPAQIKDSGVYIPYEQNKSYDALKFYHEWYYDEKTLYLVHGDNQMYFTEGKDFAVINGEKVKLAEPFFRYDSVPMLPLDILAKVCGFDVKIDGRFINING